MSDEGLLPADVMAWRADDEAGPDEETSETVWFKLGQNGEKLPVEQPEPGDHGIRLTMRGGRLVRSEHLVFTGEHTKMDEIKSPADPEQASFHFHSDPYSRASFFPKQRPRSARFVAALEFSPAPAHAEDHTYYLSSNRGRTLWFLWLHLYDEWEEESHEDVWAYGSWPKASPKEIAAQLIRTAWQGQYRKAGRKWFSVTDEGLLSGAEVVAIARELWPKKPVADVKAEPASDH